MYNTADWRTYTSTTVNIGGQTLAFYKLDVTTPAVTPIAVPGAVTGLKWTGTELTGVLEGTGYTLSGNKQTAVGTYTATAALDSGYEWSGVDDAEKTTDKQISWSIAKADAVAAPTGLAGVAPTAVNGLDGKITGVADTMEWKKAADTDYASVGTGLTEITGLEAGSYDVRVKEDANHAGPGEAATIEVPAFTPANQVATPTADPGTDTEVKVGDKITLSTATSGAAIKYTVNDGSTTSDELTYTETGIIIPDKADGTVIIVKAKAVLAGWTDSAEATFTYTVKKEASITGYTLVTSLDQLAAGKTVLIVSKDKDTGTETGTGGVTRNSYYALDTTGTSSNRTGLPIIVTGNTIAAAGTAQVFTLEAGSVANEFYLSTGSGYLYADGNIADPGKGNYLKIGTKATAGDNGRWKVSFDSGAIILLAQGTATANQICYNANLTAGTPRAIFSAYGPESATAKAANSKIALYAKDGGSTEPDKLSAPTATPKGGTVAAPTEVLTATKVTLVDAVSGATMIKYNVGTGTIADPTQPQGEGNGSIYNDTDKVTIAGNVGDVITLKAIGVKDGKASDVLTAVYKIREAGAAVSVKDAVTAINAGSVDGFTVQGQLVYKFGNYDSANSSILQQVDGGKVYALQIYSSLDGMSVGDTVEVTSSKAELYGTVPQLSGTITFKKLSSGTAPAPYTYDSFTAMDAVRNDMVSCVVKITGVKLGTYNDNGSTTMTDKDGKTYPIYRAATYPVGVAAGETLDLVAVLSKYNNTWQFRTGTISANGFAAYQETGADTKPPVITPVTFDGAAKDTAYPVSVAIVDNRGVTEAKLIYKVASAAEKTVDLVKNATNGKYEFTIPASEFNVGGKLELTITAKDAAGNSASTTKQIVDIIDLPQVTDAKPTGDKIAAKPTIEVSFTNAPTATAKLTLKQDGTTVVDNADMTIAVGKATYAVTTDLVDGIYTATVVITRTSDSKSVTYSWNFTVGEAKQKFYFGQLHSHTAEYSDGAGTLAEALNYIKNTAKNNNVQFVAFTDHSNYFDTTSAANPAEALYDPSKMTAASKAKWDKYKGDMAAFNDNLMQNGILALAGFEMTWSGGPGHMNTWNTPGIVSRNNTTLNNKNNDAGMKEYYNTLKNEALKDSVSQFNHPGKTFGTFAEFAYWDKDIDKLVTLVEVGNGEGAIGSGGYFPSYTEYTKALDKGWHVAPTNNQDNHKGGWGDANDARTVVLADSLSEADLYKAMRERKVYATEDKNLSINYTLNGAVLGSIIDKPEDGKVSIKAVISDPDTGVAGDKISKIELVANSGKVAHSWDGSGHSGTFEVTLTGENAEYSYYYLRVTQADKNIAVTAPIWVGKASVLGINSFESSTVIPVVGEEITFTTSVFNSEDDAATVKSITYDLDGKLLETITPNDVIPAVNGTKNYTYKFTPAKATDQTLTVTVVISTVTGERIYDSKILLEVLDPDKLVYVGVDASHNNEYVAGNYKDQVKNFTKLASANSVRVVTFTTGAELIAATENPKYKMIILTPPQRRSVTANPKVYSEAEIEAVANFAKAGNTVIITNYTDKYDNKNLADGHMSAEQNKLLAAMGARLRLSDDASLDETYHASSGSNRLYFGNFNVNNPLMAGIVYNKDGVLKSIAYAEGKSNDTQVWSQYDGTTIYAVDGSGNPTSTLPESVNPMVYGYLTTVSHDTDGDGKGGSSTPKYPMKQVDTEGEAVMIIASETLAGGGTVIAGGGTFLSDYEVKEMDFAGQLNYANYTVASNIISGLYTPEIAHIADVQVAEEGERFTIEGILTSNVSGFDKDTAFFDCSYLQDSTGGVNIFPISGNYQEGQKLRITGTTSSYQGERQLAIKSVKVLDQTINKIAPTLVTTKDIADNAKLGMLVKVEGIIVSYAEAEGAIQTIIVRDNSGSDARVFIDGYITKDKDAPLRTNLKVGNKITAIGLASYDDTFVGAAPRIRIRDRADINIQQGEVPPEKLTAPVASITSGSTVENDTKITFTVESGAKAVYKTTEAGSFADVPDAGVSITGAAGAIVSIWVKATKAGATDSDEIALTYTIKRTTPSGGNSTSNDTVKPSDIKEGTDTVEVNLPTSGAKLDTAANGKLITANETKSIEISGSGMKVIIPAGTLTAGADVNAMLVNPKSSGNVIKVTKPDGSTAILPIATVSGGQAAYVANIPGTYEIIDNTKTFPDTNGHWAMDAIGFASAHELFKGDATGAFNPEQPMTRGMLATVLARIDGGKTATGTNFADVPAGSWYDKEIAWAAQNKLVEGDGKNFAPDADLTREQLCIILARYLNYSGLTLDETTAMGSFTDLGSVSPWAKNAVEQAVKAGLLTGKNGGLLDPQGKATRAEIATILQRFVEGVLK